MLRKDDDFAASAIGGAHLGLVLQQARELFPLAVAARLHDGGGGAFQLAQDQNFSLQLRDGLGSGGLVHHLVGHGFVFFGAEFVGGIVQVVGQVELALDDVFPQVLAQHIGSGLELQLIQAGFELFAPARQRCVDGLRAGGQTALQLGESKAHGAFALAVQPVSTVHFVAHVVGDLVVQQHLRIRQGVVDGVRAALGEQRLAIKAQQLFLDHAAHHVGDVHFVGTLAELAIEAVTVQQRHKELEVFFFAVVGRGRHQQVVARETTQELAQLKAPGFIDLVAEVVGRHFVGLVHHNQIPLSLGQQLLVFLVARELVQAGNQAVLFGKVVAAVALLLFFAAEQLEVQAELLAQFVLPLLCQGAGRDDEHAPGIGTQGHLTNQQPCHHGLAGTGIVGQHKAQRLARQHGFVNGGNLVRQGFDVGGVYRHQGVEQVRQANAVGL